MNSAQLNAIKKLKETIKEAEKVGIFIEFDPEVGELNAGTVKENIENYECISSWDEPDLSDDYLETYYDELFETVKLCDCSQKDDDDDVTYYAKYKNEYNK